VEHVLHETGLDQFMLPVRGSVSQLSRLGERFLERAIGVIYRPDTERMSHYFYADAARQFDAILHVDRSTALRPLERSALWKHEEAPETWPTGL
jgi:erythromycin esterase-like protein